MRRRTIAIGLAAMLTGCAKPAALSVEDAWVRLPAVPGRPAAAYFTLDGGAADATLIAVATPAARRAELHESMAGGMRPLDTVRVPAGGDVRFAPGGRHVMLLDPDPRLAPGATASLQLIFADGRTVSVQARAVAAADPPPR